MMFTENAVLEKATTQLAADIRAHPFLERCRKGLITLEELKIFLVQQGFYSAYFTRYLCALMSNLPSNLDVLALAENLFEELGLSAGGPSTPHHLLYSRMLKRFGLSLSESTATPETLTLIDTMMRHCKNQNPAQGLGALCLGAEALVPSIYSDLVTGFRACGISCDAIDFFLIHIECDDGHAQTIRDIMVRLAQQDARQIDLMLRAGQELVAARSSFFSGIARQYHPASQQAASASCCK
jgi:pyrroloquinoline quinone (PQQ) biosynthesis protein C